MKSRSSWGHAAGLCTESPLRRIPSQMITDNDLDLVLPIDQGKHLPRFRLQRTKRDRVWLVYPIGPKVSPQGIETSLAAYFPRLLQPFGLSPMATLNHNKDITVAVTLQYYMVVLPWSLQCNTRLNVLHFIYIIISINIYFLHIYLQQMSSRSCVPTV